MKHFLLFCVGFFIFSLIFVTLSNAKIDIKTAAGIWLLNEKDGAEIVDLSKNGNNGKATVTAKHVAGKFGTALSFNGSSDRVVVPDADSLDLQGAWTITAWVYVNKTEVSYGHILGKRNDAVANDANYAFRINNTGVGWETYFRKDNAWMGIWGIGSVKKEEWVYMTAVYDGKNMATIYENSVQIGTGAAGAAPPAGQAEVHIGGWQNNTSELLDGKLDEVALFGAALTIDDIQNLMENGLEKSLGILPVDRLGKMATEWGSIKSAR